MTSRRLLLLSALVALLPASASAGDRSWWAWLEELSGPGYFTGFMFTVDLKCTPPEGRCGNYKAPDLTIDRGDRIKKTISVTFGRLSSGNRPRFKDLPSATGDPNLDTVYAYPLHTTVRWRLHRSMDLGPGAGVLLFSGNNVNDHVRIILIPVSASWKPALTKQSWRDSRWTRAFSIDFEAYYITQGFNGASFGSSATTYRSTPQLQGLIGISYDLGETIYKGKHP
jgi:hypothetical protein